MDFKQIQELIKIVNKSNIGELSIEQGEFKITIKQKKEEIVQQTIVSSPSLATPIAAMPTAPSLPQTASNTSLADNKTETLPSNLITIKSPMIGTFYRRPGPDKPNFVEIGDEVTPGKVVCIIEAMKLFNEIESEVSGKIVKILVEDASPVEYDQPLFLVEPA
jgi:acetyl-CoA carboxylase biotin carboxyl carrier protein